MSAGRDAAAGRVVSAAAPEIVCHTAGPDDTRELGAAVASTSVVGDVVVLVGDLGAGKTAFVQGFAAALGVTSAVTSPTFTLANRYAGEMVVNHLDTYRFESVDEAADLALSEILDDGVTLVEWGDMISEVLPEERLELTIRFGDGDEDRVLCCRLLGDSWRRRDHLLRQALSRWSAAC